MGKFGNFLRIGALAAFMAFLPSCEKDPIPKEEPVVEKPYELPKFNNVSQKIIKDNLEFPAGLSYNPINNSGKKSSNGIKGDLEGVFIEAPVFINHRGTKGIEPYQNPTISEFSGDLETLSTNSLAEIDLATYPSDFDSYDYVGKPGVSDSLWTARGLVLDACVLSDETVLSSSNSSDKLFRRNLSGGIEVFLQDAGLERITDMILGSDGKIYAVQAPLLDSKDPSKILSPKRVISIENKVITSEFILPSPQKYIPYLDANIPLFDRLKIIENSANGKEKFGAEFYVSDLLEDVIYKIDSKKEVTVLATNLKFPSSLAVDSIGTVFYTTTPMWNGEGGWNNIKYPSSIRALNPETGESSLILQFSENASEYFTGDYFYVNYPGEVRACAIPIGFHVTNVLNESKDKVEFLFTNSHQGTLKYVNLDKVTGK